MTLVNTYAGQNVGYILADSIGIDAFDGETAYLTKAVVLPHLRGLISGRGISAIVGNAMIAAIGLPAGKSTGETCKTFGVLARDITEAMAPTLDCWRDEHNGRGNNIFDLKLSEFFLVLQGADGGFDSFTFNSFTKFSPIQIPRGRIVVSPTTDDDMFKEPPEGTNVVHAMIDAAHQQYMMMVRAVEVGDTHMMNRWFGGGDLKHPGVGGDLVLYEVRATGEISVRAASRLPPWSQDESRGAKAPASKPDATAAAVMVPQTPPPIDGPRDIMLPLFNAVDGGRPCGRELQDVVNALPRLRHPLLRATGCETFKELQERAEQGAITPQHLLGLMEQVGEQSLDGTPLANDVPPELAPLFTIEWRGTNIVFLSLGPNETQTPSSRFLLDPEPIYKAAGLQRSFRRMIMKDLRNKKSPVTADCYRLGQIKKWHDKIYTTDGLLLEAFDAFVGNTFITPETAEEFKVLIDQAVQTAWKTGYLN
ncbi:MAG: hypothetical protein HQL38_19625 [Alphaproteobacteria bacterium]|nr:hypothetical protein [Alphaproteobacteria bacterium]